VENEMSQVISLAQQISKRWKLHFCSQNMRPPIILDDGSWRENCHMGVVNKYTKNVKLCIGYQFSKYISKVATNELVSRNQKLISLLSTASRKQMLLDYQHICRCLLGQSPVRVFAHRIFASRDEIRIDRQEWDQQDTSDILAVFNATVVDTKQAFSVDMHHTNACVGYDWIRQNYVTSENPKSVWERQNGMCAYCDILTFPPDGKGVGTCCPLYMHNTVYDSDKAKLHSMRRNQNTVQGTMRLDGVLFATASVFVCLACDKACGSACQNKKANTSVQRGFSHNELCDSRSGATQSTIDDLFHYISIRSRLYHVFAMYIHIVSQHMHQMQDLEESNTSDSEEADDGFDDVSGDDSSRKNIIILAYVTNIRDSECIYVSVKRASLCQDVYNMIRGGHKMYNCFNGSSDMSMHVVQDNTTNTNIYEAIRLDTADDGQPVKRYYTSNFENKDSKNQYMDRYFVVLFHFLTHDFDGNAPANTTEQVWRCACWCMNSLFTVRENVQGGQELAPAIFSLPNKQFAPHAVQRILVATCEMERTSMGEDATKKRECPQFVFDYTNVVDCVVLIETALPREMLVLTNAHAHRSLYRLVAICNNITRATSWLITENWQQIDRMPVEEKWYLSVPLTVDSVEINDDSIFSNVRSKISQFDHEPDGENNNVYTGFYQRLGKHEAAYNVPTIMFCSRAARTQAQLLRERFDFVKLPATVELPIAVKNVLGVGPKTQEHAVSSSKDTQKASRKLAVAIKLTGFLLLNQLQVDGGREDCPGANRSHAAKKEFHLFQYLLWNPFVIQKGFRPSGRVLDATILHQAATNYGCLDVARVFKEFSIFLREQCDLRNSVVTVAPWSPKALTLEFTKTILYDSTANPCVHLNHAIKNINVLENRVPRKNKEQKYSLGNTMMILHYLSCVLKNKPLEKYFSDIRNNLV